MDNDIFHKVTLGGVKNYILLANISVNISGKVILNSKINLREFAQKRLKNHLCFLSDVRKSR